MGISPSQITLLAKLFTTFYPLHNTDVFNDVPYPKLCSQLFFRACVHNVHLMRKNGSLVRLKFCLVKQFSKCIHLRTSCNHVKNRLVSALCNKAHMQTTIADHNNTAYSHMRALMRLICKGWRDVLPSNWKLFNSRSSATLDSFVSVLE